jgi:hypothetical protein
VDEGGSILVSDVDIQIFNNLFKENIAPFGSGGAIRLLCSLSITKSKINIFNDYRMKIWNGSKYGWHP